MDLPILTFFILSTQLWLMSEKKTGIKSPAAKLAIFFVFNARQ